MPQGNAAELVGVLDGTLPVPGKLDSRLQGGNLRVFHATLDLASATVAKNIADTNLLARIPAGYKPLYLVTTASVTLGTATIAIGKSGTPAKYRAAAVHTAVDAPALQMLTSAADDAPLDAEEDVILTVTTAALPGAGVLVVDIVCAGR